MYLYFYLSPDTSSFSISPYGQHLISESGAYNSDGLLGNYTDLEKDICSISDVCGLFREFGNVLNSIFVYTPTGISEDDIELINFVPDLMEFFAFDKNVLYNLCKNKELVKKILDARYLRAKGIPCIGITPIVNTPILLHDHDEFIWRESLEDGIAFYQLFLEKFIN